MLGRNYPGYFPLYDEAALARLIGRCMRSRPFHRSLKSALAARRPLFAPAAERAALASVVREALKREA